MTRRGSRTPLVSIVLCTYNRAGLVRRAIRSVLAQRYTNWELIVIDDGSTDGSRSVLEAFSRRDERVRVRRQRNQGLARARNAGLRLAAGEYVCFLDSDDEYRPTHISSRVRLLERRRKTDVLYGGLLVHGPVAKRYVADLERPGALIHVRKCYVGGTFFLRRRVLKAGFRFRKLDFGEDLDFILRAQKRFVVRKIETPRTYVYHCEGSDRMCDLFTMGRTQQRRRVGRRSAG